MRFDPVKLRRTVLEMAYAGSTVHIACAFSIIEILAVLYRSYLRYPDNNPGASDRDYLVLSKGHGVMAQYACMYELGWLSDSQIRGYFSDGSHLFGLADSRISGIEVSSGSLGHGFSVGVGLALGLRRAGTDQRVFTIVGDGELNEGPIWEGVLFAAHHNLENLLLIVDVNGYQAMGRTEDILRMDQLSEKFASFGFETLEVDGHDQLALDAGVNRLLGSNTKKPRVLIAHTVKGKGVPFMEDDNRWHYSRLDSATFAKAVALLGTSGSSN